MNQTNQTVVTYFIIKGISDVPELQTPIFLLIIMIYFLCLGGNFAILYLVSMDSQLHIPMYFFLGHLSLIDISSATVTLSKSPFSFISGDKTVTFIGCMAQMYLFTSLGTYELLILTATSYDRYMAICDALCYHIIMNFQIRSLLPTISWVTGFIEIIPTICSISLYTYKSNIVNHFFCDIVPLKELTYSDCSFAYTYIFIEVGLFVFLTPFTLTFISYAFIVVPILKIHSSTGRRKAFYTCSSHLTVVIFLYFILFCQYFRPTSIVALVFNKLFSLFNTAAVTTLNPLIYSLKNRSCDFSFQTTAEILYNYCLYIQTFFKKILMSSDVKPTVLH